jgi:hypothetical protein
VNNGTDWDVLQRKSVPWLDVSSWSLLNTVTLLQFVWSDDVTLLTICVVKQCDVSGTVRVVLDVSYLRRHSILVVTTEVNNAVLPLVSSTNMPGGDTTCAVTSTSFRQRAKK